MSMTMFSHASSGTKLDRRGPFLPAPTMVYSANYGPSSDAISKIDISGRSMAGAQRIYVHDETSTLPLIEVRPVATHGWDYTSETAPKFDISTYLTAMADAFAKAFGISVILKTGFENAEPPSIPYVIVKVSPEMLDDVVSLINNEIAALNNIGKIFPDLVGRLAVRYEER